MNRSSRAGIALCAAVMGLVACTPEQSAKRDTPTADKSNGDLIAEDVHPDEMVSDPPETELAD
jgi:hypothetical protein